MQQQLLNGLGLKHAKPSNIENTVGEVFMVDSENKHLYIDTEGFEQTINIDDPEVRMAFVINHARKCADVIILVVPMMTVSDQKLIIKSITMLKTGHSKLVVVHNLMNLETLDKIQLYKTRLEDFFESKKDAYNIITQREKDHSVTAYCGLATFHFFLGDNAELADYNRKVIDTIYQSVIHAGRQRGVPLKNSIIEALGSTYFWGYNISDLKVNTDSPGTYVVTGHMTGKREIKLGGEILSGCGLEYSWQCPYLENKDYYQNLLISTVRLDDKSVNISFEDAHSLRIEYTSTKIDESNQVVHLPNQVETILSAHAMSAANASALRINREREELPTRELCFKIGLIISQELRAWSSHANPASSTTSTDSTPNQSPTKRRETEKA